MEANETLYALALNRVKGVGPRIFKRIVDAAGSAERAFGMKTSGLVERCGIPSGVARAIERFSDWSKVEADLERCRKSGIQILIRSSEGYPRLLDLLDDAPPVLYILGELEPKDELAIAIVGTRSMTPYGKKVAHRLAGELADGGFTIVSGLARGIDSRAHTGALDAGGRTIAVLGCGLDML
ncbi:MAG TPA: DNA-protecting protein DprA, partial [Proteobacteria bacterium]|nr:DNA-protecting protein DprA [Pseudomonadota bacterium]